MEQVKWFDRSFDFSSIQNTFPSILERLSGTPARLEEKLSMLHLDILSLRVGDSWTIKENIGHLADLEPLWQGRFQDIINGQAELRPADLSNRKTDLAGHDQFSLEALLLSFRQARTHTLQLLENFTEDLVYKSALHPRLKTPMRSIDMCLFIAEHDDHHLARITALNRQLLL